jgi:rhodanese-related sulfurtransferase
MKLILSSFLFLSLLFSSSLDSYIDSISKNINSISSINLKKSYKDFLIIDIRETFERKAFGHINNDIHIERGLLEFKLNANKNKKILLYCQKGGRSILASNALKNIGFTNVYYLVDGFDSWKKCNPVNPFVTFESNQSPLFIKKTSCSSH